MDGYHQSSGTDGAPPEAGGVDLSQVTDEDIVAMLDQMVQSGEITPEIAAQIMQELQQGA